MDTLQGRVEEMGQMTIDYLNIKNGSIILSLILIMYLAYRFLWSYLRAKKPKASNGPRYSKEAARKIFLEHIPSPWVTLFITSLIGALIIMPSIFNEHSIMLKLLKEIGFALIVAAVVGVTIEAYNIRRHELIRERMQRDLFDLIYERRLTPLILAAIKRDILATPFICSRNVVHLSIQPQADSRDRVVVEIKTNKLIKNVSGSLNKYLLETRFFSAPGQHSPYKTDFTLVRVGEKIHKEGDADFDEIFQDDTDGSRMLHIEVPMESDQTLPFEVESRLVMDSNDSLPILTLLATDRLTLSIKCHDSLTCTVKAAHACVHADKEARMSRNLDSVYRIHTGLFPGNGVIVTWRKAFTT